MVHFISSISKNLASIKKKGNKENQKTISRNPILKIKLSLINIQKITFFIFPIFPISNIRPNHMHTNENLSIAGSLRTPLHHACFDPT